MKLTDIIRFLRSDVFMEEIRNSFDSEEIKGMLESHIIGKLHFNFEMEWEDAFIASSVIFEKNELFILHCIKQEVFFRESPPSMEDFDLRKETEKSLGNIINFEE